MKSIGSRIIVSFVILLLVVCLAFVLYLFTSLFNNQCSQGHNAKFAAEASLTIEDSIQNQLRFRKASSSSDMKVLKSCDFSSWFGRCQRRARPYKNDADRQNRKGYIDRAIFRMKTFF